ncbi:MAG: Beta-N-acetylhexosaminidase [Gemmatimonadetes bacterium]|nr:Beta-N-acetylhexosaminidase [Gemmatimonadota bacterium]
MSGRWVVGRGSWVVVALTLAGCEHHPDPALAYAGVIPRLVSAASGTGRFTLTGSTVVVASPGSEAAADVARYLAATFGAATGFALPPGPDSAASTIVLALGGAPALGNEGYDLTVTERGVRIEAPAAAGLFYGVQTLRQLLPPAIERPERQRARWTIATGVIRDYPRYAWRGAMLDVSRHFFGVADVKRFIDLLAAYKLNVLQLHLSDDQGWRIEIASWPRLTELGGLTAVGGGPGGFYTQAQYREIVEYARRRYITVIPEIDLPGHTNAALVAYPELNCNGKVPAPYTGIETGISSLCTRRPVVMQFVADVIRELAAITPGPFIHIGGDEADVTLPRDYVAFIDSVQRIVRAQGKTMIGWEEIASAPIDPGTVVQHWRSADLAVTGASKGAHILMSPSPHVYLDMKYDSATVLGQNWAGYIDVDTAYAWDPVTRIPALGADQVLGIVAPLWTETVSTMKEAEYLLFPRLAAIAEVAWSPADAREWNEFSERLGRHGARMSAMGIGFYRSPRIPWRDAPSHTQPASAGP